MDNDGIKVKMTPTPSRRVHPRGGVGTVESERDAGGRDSGVRRATLSDLLNGRAALSPEMALRIEKAFDVSMDLLLRMQAWHDAARMRAHADDISIQRYQPA